MYDKSHPSISITPENFASQSKVCDCEKLYCATVNYNNINIDLRFSSSDDHNV